MEEEGGGPRAEARDMPMKQRTLRCEVWYPARADAEDTLPTTLPLLRKDTLRDSEARKDRPSRRAVLCRSTGSPTRWLCTSTISLHLPSGRLACAH